MSAKDNDPAAEAMRLFSSGCNCAQSVFVALAPRLGLDPDVAMRLATGFGGGMGRLQRTCGTVTGAIMLLGLRHGMRDPADQEARKLSYEKVKQLVATFEAHHGSSECRSLLGFDLGTPDGAKRAHESCGRYVEDAVRIVSGLIGTDG